jgi:hypothetical protein
VREMRHEWNVGKKSFLSVGRVKGIKRAAVCWLWTVAGRFVGDFDDLFDDFLDDDDDGFLSSVS